MNNNPKIKDLTGQKFGRLLALSLTEERRNHRAVWRCQCDCGNYKNVSSKLLLNNTTKSCGCLYKELKNNIRELGESNLSSLYSNYRYGARTRKLDFLLTRKEFKELTSQRCHYCGSIPSQILNKVGHNGEYKYNGIDRKDNTKGYISDNCVPCCKICNYMKRDLLYSDFLTHINNIYKNLRGLYE